MPEQSIRELRGGEVASASSPLPFLFAEDKRADRQAREALFCTFNADLGFFERTVLGVTQSTGARVTVVGDAGISAPDPRAARNAGTRYVHGLAATPSGSAFHPKVTVLVGPERALVAVGSGNLSLGGWHLNAETWTVASADREHYPALVGDVVRWLQSLSGVCAISPEASASINRTVRGLEALTKNGASVETGHRLLHTSAAAILDQLPTGPVSELRLHAPFLDRDASAIDALIRRFRPDAVQLLVRPGETVMQPDSVRRVTQDLGVALTVLEDQGVRYRHGKLVEAVRPDGTLWTLTGSPNLSRSALLRSVGEGGNVEVGVIRERSGTLFPAGAPIPLSSLRPVAIPSDDAGRAGRTNLLLACERTEDGLAVTFAAPTTTAVEIDVSASTHFDDWETVGVLPSGAIDAKLPGIDRPGGTRARATWLDAGVRRYGTLLFVTDGQRVRERVGETSAPSRTARGPAELITDSRLWAIWQRAIGELSAARAAVAVPRVGGSAGPGSEADDDTASGVGLRLDDEVEDWLTYTDEAKEQVGSAMFHFALGGLPALRANAAAPPAKLAEQTDRLVDERAAGLDEDDAEAVNEDTDPYAAESTDAESDDTEAQADALIAVRLTAEKRRRARDLGRIVADDLVHLPAIPRLAVVSLVLVGIRSDLWESPFGQDGWMRVLGAALQHLDRGDIPREATANFGSVSAVGLYLLREHRPAGRTSEGLMYEAVSADIAHLCAAAEPAIVAQHALPYTNGRGFPLDPDDVMRVVALLVQGDAAADALEQLERDHPSWRAHRHSARIFHVHGDFTSPFRGAAELLEALPATESFAVWATNDRDRWAAAARRRDDLIHVEPRGERLHWGHHRLTSLISPTAVARDAGVAQRSRVLHVPTTRSFREAEDILDAVGLDIAAGPPVNCPDLDLFAPRVR
ncbi:hypothetical protein [Cryptosporangium japonicum]|uniref:PLD phosphodiesterase domain-containing protein n=1 Tax=Cryptosporangium japonicum TaxID=80872 RepID=A0ABP3EVQ9_9ACTN